MWRSLSVGAASLLVVGGAAFYWSRLRDHRERTSDQLKKQLLSGLNDSTSIAAVASALSHNRHNLGACNDMYRAIRQYVEAGLESKGTGTLASPPDGKTYSIHNLGDLKLAACADRAKFERCLAEMRDFFNRIIDLGLELPVETCPVTGAIWIDDDDFELRGSTICL